MTDDTLQRIQEEKPEQEKEYIKDTAYEQIDEASEEKVEFGTIAIDNDYARQAITAVKGRVEGTEADTKTRLDRIEQNYALYENRAINEDANSQTFIPLTYNLVEDEIDDQYNNLTGLPDSIEVTSKDSVLDRNLVRKLEIDESDDDESKGAVRSLVRAVVEQEGIDPAIIEERDKFYFKNLTAIKEFMKDTLNKSDYQTKLQEFTQFGVITGLYCIKGSWSGSTTKTLRKFDSVKDKGSVKFGSFIEEINEDKFYNFEVVDPRRLIFRKDGKGAWIEKINTNFWEILNSTLDAEGKPLDDAMFDNKMVQRVKELIFDGNMDNFEELGLDVDADDSLEENDIKRLDGDALIYEAHSVPFRYKAKDLIKRSGGGKYKGMDGKSSITLLSKITCLIIGDQYIPIGIQPENDSPYQWEVFASKKDDAAGRGMPEILEVMQAHINTNWNMYQDILETQLKALCIVREESFQNAEDLDGAPPGTILKVNSGVREPVGDLIEFVRSPVESLSPMLQIMEVLERYMKETSRTGPSRQKISPNPSATEFASLVQELEKSPMRRLLRLNAGIWIPHLESIYKVTLVARDGNFQFKLTGYRLGEPNADGTENRKEASKWVEVSPEDLFVDGIAFDTKAMDNVKKQAVEKKQSIDFLNFMLGSGLVQNQETGEPIVYEDETGQQLVYDLYGAINTASKAHGVEKPFKKFEQPQQQQLPQPLPQDTTVASPGSPGAVTAPLAGNITGGAVNVGGV